MIIYNLRKPDIDFNDDNAGVVGENLTFEEEFVIKGLADENMSFAFHLRFPDGQVNSVLPENVSVSENETHLVWLIRKNDIFSHGYFEFQIEGRNNDTVFQTEIIRLYAKESLPVEDREYENPNSETLALRDEMYSLLEQTKEQNRQIAKNEELIRNSDLTYFNNNFIKWINVVNYGVRNDYGATALAPAFENLTDNTVVYFPAGTYYVSDNVEISGHKNIKLLFAPGAVIRCQNEAEQGNYLFEFSNCSRCSVEGLYAMINNRQETGIILLNSPNTVIKNVYFERVGYAAADFACGISLRGDCSHTVIDNAEIYQVVANTIGEDNYCHACGIGFSRLSSGEYSKHVTIKNCYLHTFRYATDSGTTVQGEGIYIIQRPDETDSCDSDITIEDCTIEDFTCRAIKASARGVKINRCIIDSLSKSNNGCAVDFQYAAGSSLKNTCIRSRYTAVGIDYDCEKIVIENCEIHGPDTADNTNSGIILNRKMNKTGELYTGQNQSVIINNCTIDGLGYGIRANNTDGNPNDYDSDGNMTGYDFANISISNLTVGHLAQDKAIWLTSERVGNVGNLYINNVAFAYGSTSNEILAANNEYYENALENYSVLDSDVTPSGCYTVMNVAGVENKFDIANGYVTEEKLSSELQEKISGKADKTSLSETDGEIITQSFNFIKLFSEKKVQVATGEFEGGAINTATGENITLNGTLRSVSYIPVAPGVPYQFKTVNGNHWTIIEYDENKSVINVSQIGGNPNGAEAEYNFSGAYIRIVIWSYDTKIYTASKENLSIYADLS